MPSAIRRRALTAGVALLVGQIAGCGSVGRRGVKHTLSMEGISDRNPVEEPVLDFDATELSSGEHEVLDSAIENGEYTEGYVNWNDVPDGSTISKPFKSVVLRLANHERSAEEKELGTPHVSDIEVETFARYDGDLYETRVTSISAE